MDRRFRAPLPRLPPPHSPATPSPRLRALLDDLARGTVSHLIVGHTPLHAVHSQSAQTVSAQLASCTSLLSLTIRTRHCSPQALEVLLRGAASCPSLQRVSVLGGVGLADAQALARGLAAFHRPHPTEHAAHWPRCRGGARTTPRERQALPSPTALRLSAGGVEWSWEPLAPPSPPVSGRQHQERLLTRGHTDAPASPLPPVSHYHIGAKTKPAIPSGAQVPRRLAALGAPLAPASGQACACPLAPIHLELEFAQLDEKCASILFLKGVQVATRVMSATVQLTDTPTTGTSRRAVQKFANRVQEVLSQRRCEWSQMTKLRTPPHTPPPQLTPQTAQDTSVARARVAATEAVHPTTPRCSPQRQQIRGPCAPQGLRQPVLAVSPRRSGPSAAAAVRHQTPPSLRVSAGKARKGRDSPEAAPTSRVRPRTPSPSPETQRNRRRTIFFLQMRRERRAVTPSCLPSSTMRRYSPARFIKNKPHSPLACAAISSRARSDASPLASARTVLSLCTHQSNMDSSPDPHTPQREGSERNAHARRGRGTDISSRCGSGVPRGQAPCSRSAATPRGDNVAPSSACTGHGAGACFVCEPFSCARPSQPEWPLQGTSDEAQLPPRHHLCPPDSPRHAHRPRRSPGERSCSHSSHGLTPARGASVDDDEDKNGLTPLSLDHALAGVCVQDRAASDEHGGGTPHRTHPCRALSPHRVHGGRLAVLPCSDSFADVVDAVDGVDGGGRAVQRTKTPPLDAVRITDTSDVPPPAALTHTSAGRDVGEVGRSRPHTPPHTRDAVGFVRQCVSQINAALALHTAKTTLAARSVVTRVDELSEVLRHDVSAQMTEILVALEQCQQGHR